MAFNIKGRSERACRDASPVRLLALERSKVWHGQEEQRRLRGDVSEVEKTRIRKEERDTLFSRWQEEWDASGYGR